MPRKAKAKEAPKKAKNFETAEELQEAIDLYFEKCAETGEVCSEAGLALYLGISVACLRHWHDGDRKPELQETARDAYARMTANYMQLLLTGNKNMTPFVIFMLKQTRFAGYQDKVEAKQDIAVNVKMGDGMDASDFQ